MVEQEHFLKNLGTEPDDREQFKICRIDGGIKTSFRNFIGRIYKVTSGRFNFLYF